MVDRQEAPPLSLQVVKGSELARRVSQVACVGGVGHVSQGVRPVDALPHSTQNAAGFTR